MAQSRGRQHQNNGSTYPRHPLGKRSLAFTLNLKRRHLNREQRRELIAESLKSDPQLSNREHARRTGAHQTTVGTVRKEMVEDGQVSQMRHLNRK
ncbi:hypothetical protein [Corynebacterium casei]|uniref:hypothetical protein n=1 Tax=Corynebacterium casei TaxID=160386 RepID=UPI000552E87F|nr:hypothetical protein [Corynebacterium casei]